MHKVLFCILFSIIFFFSVKGKDKYVIDSTRIDNTGLIEARLVKNDFFDTFKNDADFNYERISKEDGNTLWGRIKSRILYWISKQIYKASGYYSSLNIVFKLLFWLFILCALIFAISKLNIQRLFYTEDKSNHKEYFVNNLNEDIEDIDAVIAHEVNNKNFRKAIRYNFIGVLRLLDNNKIIKLSDEKTNFDYIKETRKSNLASDTFIKLVNIYNAVWYGHFDIDETAYYALNEKFVTFKSSFHEEN